MASSSVTPLPKKQDALKSSVPEVNQVTTEALKEIKTCNSQIEIGEQSPVSSSVKSSSIVVTPTVNNVYLVDDDELPSKLKTNKVKARGRPPLPPTSRASKKYVPAESRVLPDLFVKAVHDGSSGESPSPSPDGHGDSEIEIDGVDAADGSNGPTEVDNSVSTTDDIIATPGSSSSPHEIMDPSEVTDSTSASASACISIATPSNPSGSTPSNPSGSVTPAPKAPVSRAPKRARASRAKNTPIAVKKNAASSIEVDLTTHTSGEEQSDERSECGVASIPVSSSQSCPVAPGSEESATPSESLQNVTETSNTAESVAVASQSEGKAEDKSESTTENTVEKVVPMPADKPDKKRKRVVAVLHNVSALKTTESEISPEVRVKIQCHSEKMKAMAAELTALEQQPDMCDWNLDLENSIASLCSPPVPENHPPMTPPESSDVEVEARVNALIGLCVQGRSEPLPALVPLVTATLHLALQHLTSGLTPTPTHTHSTDSPSSTEESYTPPSAPSQDPTQDPTQASQEWRTAACAALQKLSDPVVLGERVKSIAERVPYGTRVKGAPLFEDADLLSVWRWETISYAYFNKAGLAVRSTAKTTRARYGRLIKAIGKVVEQLGKCSMGGVEAPEQATIAVLEEAAAKALSEVAKATERRREVDKKRKAEAEEKTKKEALKEILKLKKEETAAAEKKEKNAEKENQKKVPTEKELKQAIMIEKQRSVMLGFFNAEPKTTASSSSSSSVRGSAGATVTSGHPTRVQTNRASLGGLLTCSSSSSSSAASACTPSGRDIVLCLDGTDDPTHGTEPPILRVARRGVEEEAFDRGFESALAANISMGEMVRSLRERPAHPRSLPKGKRRPLKILSVTVSVAGNSFSLGPEVYSEVRDIRVNSRMKMLCFAEDTRPPYMGTFSKPSRVLTGRRPFEKDFKTFNYDFDSEMEWDEGDGEGEDIGESDDEDDGEADELEYDDFLRQDNDFGSDADSDGEVASAAAIQRREGMETLGPRFLNYPHTDKNSDRVSGSPRCAIKLDSEFRAIACSEREKDVARLSAYSAVVFAKRAMLPFLGGGDKKIKAKLIDFDESLVCALAKHVHGSKEGMDRIVSSFQALHPTAGKAQIRRHIIDMAEKGRHPLGHGSQRWMVGTELRSRAGIEGEGEDVLFTPKKSKKAAAAVVGTPSLSTAPALASVPRIVASTVAGVGDSAPSAPSPTPTLCAVKAKSSPSLFAPPSKVRRISSDSLAPHTGPHTGTTQGIALPPSEGPMDSGPVKRSQSPTQIAAATATAAAKATHTTTISTTNTTSTSSTAGKNSSLLKFFIKQQASDQVVQVQVSVPGPTDSVPSSDACSSSSRGSVSISEEGKAKEKGKEKVEEKGKESVDRCKAAGNRNGNGKTEIIEIDDSNSRTPAPRVLSTATTAADCVTKI